MDSPKSVALTGESPPPACAVGGWEWGWGAGVGVGREVRGCGGVRWALGEEAEN